jgi:four helix bundle protein
LRQDRAARATDFADRERSFPARVTVPARARDFAKGTHTMTFDAYDHSLSLLRTLRPLLEKLGAIDPKLADQLRRAAQSTTLNIAEANRRSGRDRRNRFRISLGSADEVAAALDVAMALGYLDELATAPALELVDRVRAMTYRLCH